MATTISIDEERAYEHIRAERERSTAKGRDAAYYDKRTREDWMKCLREVFERFLRCPVGSLGWARMWIKVGSIAVAAIQSHERKHGPLPPPDKIAGIDLGEEPQQ